ncbi:hypothetical protein [Streptomyces sp. B1I3]|uniref:hypothetical protein n=1 Tax=Streptomyces sp. B1I3 TaxID=3042264 RepID=UPI0027D7B26A|nr:hypothetical protein [Streptomyces sp. B1I3]
MKEKLTNVLARTLTFIRNPNAAPEDRVAYTIMVEGFTEALRIIEDPYTAPEDKAAYTRLVATMTEAVRRTLPRPSADAAESSAAAPKWVNRSTAMKGLVWASRGLGAQPEDPKDRKIIQAVMQEACEALKTVQDPDASPEERVEAKKKLAQRTEALRNHRFADLMREVKRYRPETGCVKTIENRTRRVGWPEGTVWGLSDPLCAPAVAEGARQERSQWRAVLVCVQRDPFSTCVHYIPAD